VSGAEIGGVPVAITDRGIEAASGSAALAPVVDSLVEPMKASGISVHTTPAQKSQSDGQASALSGSLVVEYKTVVNGYPAVLTIFLGQTQASIEVSGFTPDASPPGETTVAGNTLDLPATALGSPSGLPDASVATPPAGLGPAGPSLATGAGPRTRRVRTRTTTLAEKPIDFRGGYPPLLLTAFVVLAAPWWIMRRSSPGRSVPISDLRSLWRW